MTVEIKRTGNSLQSLIDKLKQKTPTLKIGFFDQENATKAYYNEYGSAIHKVPARPFMQMTSDKYKSSWVKALAKLFKKTGDMFTAMSLLAEQTTIDMQNMIQTGSYTPNAPSTVKKKGKNSPLLDTHDMFRHVRSIPEKE